jgi:YVTN family beta-propeller protein
VVSRFDQWHMFRRRQLTATTVVTALVCLTLLIGFPELVDADSSGAVVAAPHGFGHALSRGLGLVDRSLLVQPFSARAGPGYYRAITTGAFAPAVKGVRPLVYVPNNLSNSVTVIDPQTFKLIRTFGVGSVPQHVTPSWDLKHLYVGNTYSNMLTVIDPRTGKPRGTIPVYDPYNLYFTLDGKRAIDVAERMNTLFFYTPHTWRIIGDVFIPWAGADHLDFSADGKYLFISTEYTGRLVKVDTRKMKITKVLDLGGKPIDVKMSPDGSVFYVANQGRMGVSIVDPRRMKEIKFIPTGLGAHGFCISRNARFLYVSNRLEGSISVIRFATGSVVAKWWVGGSPDMLQVSPDGHQLWASNRFSDTISVISTRTGRVLHTIKVGTQPHGLTYFPQPGRFCIGHNGVYR